MKLSLDDAVHTAYSYNSTTFYGTMLGARFLTLVIYPNRCDTNTLTFSPLISFRISILAVLAYSELLPWLWSLLIPSLTLKISPQPNNWQVTCCTSLQGHPSGVIHVILLSVAGTNLGSPHIRLSPI